MASIPSPSNMMDHVLLMGSKLKSDVRDAITSADISMSSSQVTQLTINMVDPKFKILKSGLFKIGTPVRYKDLAFTVSSVETKSISSTEAITFKCRPQIVTKLKGRQGTKVMKKVSPSDFVKSECKAVGAKYLIQPSSKRSSVARDKPKKGEKYQSDVRPSSWTTFARLADELGFILFEVSGTIYFGKPSYLLNASKKSAMKVSWHGQTATNSETVPSCNKSVDASATNIQVTLPQQRAKECRVGRAVKLSGVPMFDGYYLIDEVSYNLSGQTNRITLSASTAVDPEANPPAKPAAPKSSTSTIGGTIYKIVNGTTKGSWPINRKYKVGTPFGRRGSWAAGYHTGVDFPAPRGVPVYAVYGGIISIGGWGSAYGKHVILKVGSKRFGYCHLSSIKVHSGQSVKSGQILGYVGDTGRAFGTHLHFEYRTSPYAYGRNSHNPIPQLGKTITTQKRVAVGKAPTTKYPAGSSNSKTASAFVAKALTRKGDRYVFGARRTYASNTHTFDCSSLVYWALGQVGIKGFGTTTYSQKPYLARKGKSISLSTAMRTRGAVMYTRSLSHVAISLGNGRTIEAANSRVGVVSYSASGRGFYYCYKIPGLRY